MQCTLDASDRSGFASSCAQNLGVCWQLKQLVLDRPHKLLGVRCALLGGKAGLTAGGPGLQWRQGWGCSCTKDFKPVQEVRPTEPLGGGKAYCTGTGKEARALQVKASRAQDQVVADGDRVAGLLEQGVPRAH